MNDPVLLFTSLSSKVALFRSVQEQAKFFSPKAKVIGTDCNPFCVGRVKVDFFCQTPKTNGWNTDDLLTFCKKYKISHIVPTRDGELVFWARNKKALKEKGIDVMVSSEQAIINCQDKYEFSKSWPQECLLQPVPTFTEPEEIGDQKFVVKERRGSGSKKIGLKLAFGHAKEWAASLREPIFQPYLEGPELSAETWINREGKCHGMLLRWRKVIVNGESHETEVFKDRILEEKIKTSLELIDGLYGHCLVQLIIPANGEPILVEINPRLGGATPLALYAGIKSISWFLLESHKMGDKIPTSPTIKYGSKLFKKNGQVRIENPFTSRQDNGKD